jgi:predicted enzyme related to lactoylglutathione lyase
MEDMDYDRRQYRRMLGRLMAYKNNALHLRELIDDLAALLAALENVRDEWRKSFQDRWGDLEVTYAIALDQNRSLDEQDRKLVEEAVDVLKALVQSRLADFQLHDGKGDSVMALVGNLMEVILYVQDMSAQVAFYRDTLGLKVKEPQGITDFRDLYWVELETGECTLVLHGGGQRRLGQDAPKIVFRVADIQVARGELLRRGVQIGEVRSPAPGVLVCDGRDPEGNAFSIEARG